MSQELCLKTGWVAEGREKKKKKKFNDCDWNESFFESLGRVGVVGFANGFGGASLETSGTLGKKKEKEKNSELLYVLFQSLIRTANRVIIVLCTHSAPEQGLRTERVGAGREEKNEKKTRTGSR